MRETFGGTMLLQLVMIFIVIYVCILAVAINYSITFRTKNQIVNIIEQYEGAKNAIPVIEDYIENVGYYNSTIKTVNNGKCDIGNSNYCITAHSSGNGGIYYKVTTYVKFSFPVVGELMNFPVSGDTIVMYNYDSETEIIEPIINSSTECTTGDVEFIGWGRSNLPSMICIEDKSTLKEKELLATYRVCSNDGKWQTQGVKITSPAVEVDGNIVYTWEINEEANGVRINDMYSETVEISDCNVDLDIIVPGISKGVSCGSGTTLQASSGSIELRTQYSPATSKNRNANWQIISGNEYVTLSSKNPGNSCVLNSDGTNCASTATLTLTDKAKELVKTNKSLQTIVKVSNNKGSESTCVINIVASAPTCEINIVKGKIQMDYQSDIGVSEYGLTTIDNPTYTFKNSPTLKTGTYKPNKILTYGVLYGYVKDSLGNEGVCSSNPFKHTKSKTITTTYPCSVACGSYKCGTMIVSGTGGVEGCNGMVCFEDVYCTSYCDSTCSTTSTVYYCDPGYTKINNSYCIESTDINLDWDEAGGESVFDGSCTYLEDLTLPAAPTRDGYTFAGWKLLDGTIKPAGTTISGGCVEKYIGTNEGTSNVITAQWCRNCIDQEHTTCKLTANTSKGTCTYKTTCENKYHYILGQNTYRPICGDNETITIDYNENSGEKIDNGFCKKDELSLTLPSAPIRNGYTFTGWKLNNKEIKQPGEMVMCTKEYIGTISSYKASGIQAQWVKNEVTIDFNEDGGSKVDNVVCTFNDKLVLPTTIPTKEGYTFNGWLLADGKTIKKAGASITSGCVEKYIGSTVGTATGIKALWCQNCQTDEHATCTLNAGTAGTCSYTTSCEKNYHVISGNKTFNPVCVNNETITLNYNENSGEAIADGYCNLGSTFVLPSAPIREGYTFTGWKLSNKDIKPAGSNVNCDKAYIGTISSTKVATGITAQWQINTIEVDFNENGGSSVSNLQCTYNGTLNLPSTPTRENYMFAGWVLANGTITTPTQKSISSGCVLKNLATTIGTSTAITANWCHNCNTIENGTCKLTLLEGACNYTTTCDTGYSSQDGGNYDSTCTPNEIEIDWNENGGNTIENGTCKFNDDLVLPVTTKEGYTFNGWLLADGKTKKNAGEVITGGCIKTNTGVNTGASTKIKALWCQNCVEVTNGTCVLNASVPGTCTYTTSCNDGYKISNNGKYNMKCTKK